MESIIKEYEEGRFLGVNEAFSFSMFTGKNKKKKNHNLRIWNLSLRERKVRRNGRTLPY
jgi:hypothetical protein